MYQLYYYPLNASMAPHLVLAELGVDYELVLVDRTRNAQNSSEYLALNPAGRIPTLVHGQVTVRESAAICLYVCESTPGATLIPASTASSRAAFYQKLIYLTNTLQSELMMYVYAHRHTTDTDCVPSITAAQENRVTQMFVALDRELEDRDFLVGSSLTVCDYFLFMLCVWADEFKRPPLSFGNLSRYLRKLARRPALRRVCEKENLSLEDYR